MDDVSVMDAPEIDIDAALPAAPGLPAGVPGLAHHLSWALGQIREMASGSDVADLAGPYQEAVAALEALPTVPSGTVKVQGQWMWRDERGALLPDSVVRVTDKLTDEVVRTIATGAIGISGILSRFRERSLAEVYDLLALLAQHYGVERTGRGSVTLPTVDGLWQLKVVNTDRIDFGPEIAAARDLLEEYLAEQPAGEDLKVLIRHAFGLDRPGDVRAAEILRLRRYEIAHPKWQAAMRAITDAMRSVGAKEYLRVYRRDAPGGEWRLVPLDVAAA